MAVRQSHSEKVVLPATQFERGDCVTWSLASDARSHRLLERVPVPPARRQSG